MGLLDFLFPAIQAQESMNNPNAVSPKGAFGLMQLMPDTARNPGFGVKPYDFGTSNPSGENQRVGRDYFTALYQKYGGDVPTALMAYNWGPGNVDKWIAGGKRGPIPTETQNYVKKIMANVSPGDTSAPAPVTVADTSPPTPSPGIQPMLLGPASNAVDMAPQTPAPAPQTGPAPMAKPTPSVFDDPTLDNGGGLLGNGGLLGGGGLLGLSPTARQMLMAFGGGLASGSTQGWGAGIGAGLQNAQQAYMNRIGLMYKMQELALERRKAQLMGIKDVPDISGMHHLLNVNPDDNTATPVDMGSGSVAPGAQPLAPVQTAPAQSPVQAPVTPPVAQAPQPPATPPAPAPVAVSAPAASQFNEDALRKLNLPEEVNARARAMAVGDLPIPTSSRNNPLNNAATTALLAYTNGKPDTGAYARKQAINLSQTTGDIGKAANAFRALVGHTVEGIQSINDVNNGPSKIWNAAKNEWVENVGGAGTIDKQNKLAQLKENVHTLAAEAEKVWEVGGGSEGAMKAWEDSFPINGPRQTQIAALQKLVDMVETKAGSIQTQVDQGVAGTATPGIKVVTPELKTILDGVKKLSTSEYETPTAASIQLLQAQPNNKALRTYFEGRFGPADKYLTPSNPTMGM